MILRNRYTVLDIRKIRSGRKVIVQTASAKLKLLEGLCRKLSPRSLVSPVLLPGGIVESYISPLKNFE